jgi:uncharacterized lipoprotein YajG
MNFHLKIITILFALFGLNACVYFPQNVSLNPQITSYGSNIGDNQKIVVEVTDKRDDKYIIGRRGNGLASIAPIKNHQNLEKLIKTNVEDYLEKKEFVINEKSGKILNISLLSLKYQSLYGFVTIGSKIDAVLDVLVQDKNKKIIYENVYRSNLEKRHALFAPLASTNAENINLSFQDVINKMLADNDLLKSLK